MFEENFILIVELIYWVLIVFVVAVGLYLGRMSKNKRLKYHEFKMDEFSVTRIPPK